MRKKEIVTAICFFAALFIFIAVFSAVTIPKRVSYGANWGSFLREEKDSVDVMFFGSSVVYCDVDPSVIKELTNRSAYVLAGPEQTIPTTYYYVKEAFNTQSPSLVFVEVTGMFYSRYTSFTKANIGYMPWSPNRIAATFKAAERKEWLGLLFPPFNYHDRWNDIELDSFKGYDADTLRGYTFLDEARDVGGITIRSVDYNEKLYRENLSYLQKIAELCAKNGSKPVFYTSPSYGRWDEKYQTMLEKDIAKLENAVYFNFNDDFEALGIDDKVDFYDFLHFNNSGARKFTAYLSEIISGL